MQSKRFFEPSSEILVFMASEGGLLEKTRALGGSWDLTLFFFPELHAALMSNPNMIFWAKSTHVYFCTRHTRCIPGHIMKCCGVYYLEYGLSCHYSPDGGQWNPFFSPRLLSKRAFFGPSMRRLCASYAPSVGSLLSLFMASAGPLYGHHGPSWTFFQGL